MSCLFIRSFKKLYRWTKSRNVQVKILLLVLGIGMLFLLSLFFIAVFMEGWKLFPSRFSDSKDETEPKHSRPHADKRMINLRVNIMNIMGGGPLVLPQTHEAILKFIRGNRHLRPSSSLQYNLSDPDTRDPSRGEAFHVLQTIGHKEKGTFIECRAFDGETGSNTLFMEQKLGWKGLLVEPDPVKYEELLTRNRKAWTSNLCLSTKPYPYLAYIENGTVLGDIHDCETISKVKGNAKIIQCMPFFSIISALKFYDVDYFSLNWGGNELAILMTVPFEQIRFQVISVPWPKDSADEVEMIKFMDSKGYSSAPKLRYWNSKRIPNLLFVPKTDPTFFYGLSN